MTGGKEYLRAPEIVALTGMSLRTVRRWLADEILPSTKVRGARIVAMADLTAMLAAPQDTIQEPSHEQKEYDEESKE
jgi:predicted DNA-binding transcriptional regulator AlpA